MKTLIITKDYKFIIDGKVYSRDDKNLKDIVLNSKDYAYYSIRIMKK